MLACVAVTKTVWESSMTKPLIARASFANAELTDDQIARVSGGDDMVTEPGGGCDHGDWTFLYTMKDNKPDTGDKCGDY